jgi:hypothetical protein
MMGMMLEYHSISLFVIGGAKKVDNVNNKAKEVKVGIYEIKHYFYRMLEYM